MLPSLLENLRNTTSPPHHESSDLPQGEPPYLQFWAPFFSRQLFQASAFLEEKEWFFCEYSGLDIPPGFIFVNKRFERFYVRIHQKIWNRISILYFACIFFSLKNLSKICKIEKFHTGKNIVAWGKGLSKSILSGKYGSSAPALVGNEILEPS